MCDEKIDTLCAEPYKMVHVHMCNHKLSIQGLLLFGLGSRLTSVSKQINLIMLIYAPNQDSIWVQPTSGGGLFNLDWDQD